MEAIEINIQLRLPNEEKNISFRSGSRVALVGPSGCGKSTLVKVLVGVSDLGSGSFTFHGNEMMNLKAWERGIGYVPQDLLLMPHLSVKENLCFPVNGKINTEVNEGLGISHLLERMPRNLSGGEKQRVALARALSCHPKLLILDEPFSSLDFRNKENMVAFVDQFCGKRNLPLIFISHEVREIEQLECDRREM